jgi:hypothetical protein
VKKTISIIVLAALLLAALLVFVCTDVKFDNPLDEKGTNFLGGHAKEDDYPAECKSLATNADGVPAFIYEPVKCQGCDGSMPTLKLEGPQSVTITTNDVDEFRKWMHRSGGWADLISWGTGYTDVAAKEPRLTKGGSTDVTVDANKTPEPGDYVIIYRIERPECNGKVPAKEESRQLKVEKYVAADTAGPKIALLGNPTVEVIEGETDKYKDDGVLVMSSPDSAKKYLDSITVSRRTQTGVSVVHKLVKPIDDFAKIAIPRDAAAGQTFTITYYASRNGKNDRATRTVNIIEQTSAGQPKPVIVLNTYKHVIGGKNYDNKDTAVSIGEQYVEKGVKEVYYMKEGAKVSLDVKLVTISPSNVSTNGSPFREIRITYSISAGAGYDAATEQRSVYLVEKGCGGKAPPTITEKVPGSITIPAGVKWNHTTTWEVGNMDKDDPTDPDPIFRSAGVQYFVDYGSSPTLNPDNPAKGTYTITYVGLGACGSTASKTKTVKVE